MRINKVERSATIKWAELQAIGVPAALLTDPQAAAELAMEKLAVEEPELSVVGVPTVSVDEYREQTWVALDCVHRDLVEAYYSNYDCE